VKRPDINPEEEQRFNEQKLKLERLKQLKKQKKLQLAKLEQ
jgi:hypothetical protein